MQTGKLWRLVMALVLLLVVATPTAVFALEGKGGKQNGTAVHFQEGDDPAEEEAVTQEGGSDGVGFVLTLIIGIIALIIFMVAILGAVGLGLIGIGYVSASPGEE